MRTDVKECQQQEQGTMVFVCTAQVTNRAHANVLWNVMANGMESVCQLV